MSNFQRYTVLGAMFGALFPLFATLLDIWSQGLPFSFSSAIAVQTAQPLHWMIDCSPLVLGLFASFAGKRQDDIEHHLGVIEDINTQLHERIRESKTAEQNARSALEVAEGALTWAERRQAETEALAREQEWLFSSMPMGLASFNKAGELLDTNRAFNDFVEDHQDLTAEIFARARGFLPGAPAELVHFYHPDFEKFALIGRVDRREESEGDFWVVLIDDTEKTFQQRQLAQSSKLAVLGELSADTAHELNQPLQSIVLSLANAEKLLVKDEIDADAVIKKIERAKKAADRAGRVMTHMRVFGRSESDLLEPISVVSALEGAMLMMEASLEREGIEISVDIDDGLPRISGHETKLEQVLINLMSNARDAIVETNSPERKILVHCSNGRKRVHVEFRDTGGGMTPEQLDKVFNPFYTTKVSGKGTGLGGSISHGIVESFGGTITAKNWSQGAMFELQFPALEQAS